MKCLKIFEMNESIQIINQILLTYIILRYEQLWSLLLYKYSYKDLYNSIMIYQISLMFKEKDNHTWRTMGALICRGSWRWRFPCSSRPHPTTYPDFPTTLARSAGPVQRQIGLITSLYSTFSLRFNTAKSASALPFLS